MAAGGSSLFVGTGGSNWTLVGSHTPGAGIVLSLVGLTAAQDLSDLRIPTDFDYIRFYAAPQAQGGANSSPSTASGDCDILRQR